MFVLLKKHISKLVFVLVAMLTGVVATAYSYLFTLGEKAFHFLLGQNVFIYFSGGLSLLILSWVLIYFLSPEAKGSGIPQVMYSLTLKDSQLDAPESYDGIKIRTAIIKILSSIICLVGGGAIGREGPTIQIGACIFQGISRKFNKIVKLENTISPKAWIIAGASAGLAAAFNTPLGGLVFAMEELVSDRFSDFKNEVLLAIIVAGMSAIFLNGSYLYLGIPDVLTGGFASLGYVLIVIIISSIAGTVFGFLLKKIVCLRKQFKGVKTLLLVTFIFAFILLTASLFVPEQVTGSGKELIQDILFTTDVVADWKNALYRILAPVITYGIGSAGGIFAPSLAAGASLGHLCSSILDIPSTFTNLLVLVGMVSFLTAVTRAPFTSFVLVLEMTDRHSVIFFMMFSSLIAYLISHSLDKKSFYQFVVDDYVSS